MEAPNILHCNDKSVGMVQMLGAPYTVTQVDGLLLFGEQKSGVLWGNDIFIMKDISTHEQRSTLIHELLHAASSALGLDLKEADVLRLEAAVSSFILDEDNMKVLNKLELVEDE